MGRYITEKIYYGAKEWSPDDLIFWGQTCALRHSDVTMEIAAHIFNAAFVNRDEELANACRELMKVAGSPCHFVPNYSAERATANNNRPSDDLISTIPSLLKVDDEVEGEWDDCMDYIFDKRVRPQALFHAMKGIKYSTKIKVRRFYYVAYRVFDAINYFSKGTSEHQYLQWINLHFNDIEHKWIDDHDHIYLFRFKLDGSAKELKVHPSKWNTIKMYSDLAEIHYNLAKDLKNTFTFVVDGNGNELKDSDSYEHLKDYPQFLSGAIWYDDKYLFTEDVFINRG